VSVVLDRYRHLFPAEIERTTAQLDAMFTPVSDPSMAAVTALNGS